MQPSNFHGFNVLPVLSILMASFVLLPNARASPLTNAALQERKGITLVCAPFLIRLHLLIAVLPPTWHSNVFYWPDLERYCTSNPGAQCDCIGKNKGDRVSCKNGPDEDSRFWFAAPLTRSCEDLCICQERPSLLRGVSSLPVHPPNPFADEARHPFESS